MIILYNCDTKKLKIYDNTNIINVVNDLYYQIMTLPTVKIIMEQKKQIQQDNKLKNIFHAFEKDKIKKEIKKIKINLSELHYVIPLYDVYTDNVYLIKKENVFNRITYNNYRFIDFELLNSVVNEKKILKKQIDKIKQTELEILDELKIANKNNDTKTYIKKKHDMLQIKKYKRYDMLIKFMKSFDLMTLFNTFVKVIYLYTYNVGKNITTCKRPSFTSLLRHVKPYYTRSEIINLALNMKLITPDQQYYTEEKLKLLCQKITKNDVTSDMLLSHQNYIIKKKQIGLMQYYTLHGSAHMNYYLRNMTIYEHKNKYLEDIILKLYETINDAPKFDNDYIVYRFVNNDNHIRSIDIGEQYIEKSFTSTTRNPFYKAESYQFGYILIKIKIPKNVKGVALCMESLSHFPDEEEILFGPMSVFRLDSRDDDTTYYNTDENISSSIKTKYEFTYVGKEKINFNRITEPNNMEIIDFIQLKTYSTYSSNTTSLQHKIDKFVNNYTNELGHFGLKLKNENIFNVVCENYDGLHAYKKFYAIETPTGFSMHTISPDNYMLFLIEIAENPKNKGETIMAVNYCVKYSMIKRSEIIDDAEFILFISSIAYYFEIDNVVLYCDYVSCHANKNNSDDTILDDTRIHTTSKYCTDFYDYIKCGKKKYEDLEKLEMKEAYSYRQLDMLKKIVPIMMLKKDDFDEIYQIYKKTYKPTVDKSKDNVACFFVWIVDNQCHLVDIFIGKMSRIYRIDNPFINDFYIIEPYAYLYNKSYIGTMPFRALNSRILQTMKSELDYVVSDEKDKESR